MPINTTPIYRPVPTTEAYEYWLARIERVESLTVNSRPADTLDIGYLLFPLMNSISQSLFKQELRKYLEVLGISHPHLVQTMFRNGLMHSARTYRLEYDDGVVLAQMSSSGGTGGFLSYNAGYTNEEFPELNMPAEVVFEYFDGEDGEKYAWLQLDRLAALVRHDLNDRKGNDMSDSIDFFAGWTINAPRPTGCD